MPRYAAERFLPIEVLVELVGSLSGFFAPFDLGADLSKLESLIVEPLSCVGLVSPSFGNDIQSTVQDSVRVRQVFGWINVLFKHHGAGLTDSFLCQHYVGQRLQTLLTGDGGPRAASRLEGQVNCFQRTKV